ncbi:protein phosphatase 2C domain-containing protein [Nocardiopsis mangrovi]|uniref:Protein phosphatase 2C domain-containing protein n=1 Tax=Nocardiopsis mangrovi TaxID=1179818 RepID=A0ABV9DXU7_9ACTN
MLLDGASTPAGVETGCVHGVAWYTRRLGGLLLAHMTPGTTLADALGAAIEAATSLHSATCDLSNQESPPATVVAVRFTGERLDYLVLSDSVLVLDHADGRAEAVIDTRLDELKDRLGRESQVKGAARAYRNIPDGFWTAGADPRAAREAITGTVPGGDLARFAMLTDGASRIVDLFGQLTWRDALRLGVERGPQELIRRVRETEGTDPEQRRYPRGKHHDDATVVVWRPSV